MHVTARSYLTAGVAVFGAGAIALSPVQPLPGDLTLAPQKAISEMAVDLAAAVLPVAPIQNIIDVITASGANLIGLLNNWTGGVYVDGTFPFPDNTPVNGNLGWRTGGYASGVALPILAQILSNLEIYLGELPDIAAIAGQIFANLGNALRSPFEAGAEETARAFNLIPDTPYNQNVNAVPYISFPLVGAGSQRDVWALLPTLAGASYAALKPILDFATTPISGVLVGAIGPIVAPVLAVVNSVTNAFALLQESNPLGAVIELINIPANAIGAFLNGGQTLDLTGLVGLLGVELPPEIKSIGLQMGGLLSPGGVAFDALAAEADALGATLAVTGLPVGPLGALAGLTNYVAKSIVVTPPTTEVAREAAVVEAVDEGVAASRVAAPAAAAESGPAPAADVAEPAALEAASEVAAADDSDKPAPAPKRERRGAAARGADSGGASASTDGGDAKPARAARRAG